LEARERAYFKEEHARLLTLIASRIAVSIENARLYTRIVKQAGTLALLNEISRDLTSILNVDQDSKGRNTVPHLADGLCVFGNVDNDVETFSLGQCHQSIGEGYIVVVDNETLWDPVLFDNMALLFLADGCEDHGSRSICQL